jgi:hypothetical protein
MIRARSTIDGALATQCGRMPLAKKRTLFYFCSIRTKRASAFVVRCDLTAMNEQNAHRHGVMDVTAAWRIRDGRNG